MIRLLFTLCLFLSLNLTAEKAIKALTLDWQPYVGKELKNYGVTSQIIKEAFAAEGYTISFKFVPWAKGLKDVLSNKADILYPAYYNDERAKIYHISEAFFKSETILVKHSSSDFKYNGFESLKGLKIGITRGYSYGKDFDETKGLIKQEVSKEALNFQKLLKKRIDIMPIDKLVFKHYMSSNKLGDQLVSIEPAISSNDLHLLFSKKDPKGEEKLKAFNSGLKKIKDSGRYQEIIKEFNF